MIRLDSFGRAAVSATSHMLFEERLPFDESEVSASGGGAPFVPSDARVGTSSLQIPLTPLLVVVEGRARILSLSLPVPLSLARA